MYEELRREYQGKPLGKSDVGENPIDQLQCWIDDASAHVGLANAMALSTATKSGAPSQRMVLLKDISDSGLVFFTNYQSRKAKEIDENNQASLLFYWQPLDRQVRVEGTLGKLDRKASENYFDSRPRDSNLSAMASPQSEVVPSRADLENRVTELQETYDGQPLPYPEHWGGFILAPTSFEFWQGRADRLHDRISYQKQKVGWEIARLAP